MHKGKTSKRMSWGREWMVVELEGEAWVGGSMSNDGGELDDGDGVPLVGKGPPSLACMMQH